MESYRNFKKKQIRQCWYLPISAKKATNKNKIQFQMTNENNQIIRQRNFDIIFNPEAVCTFNFYGNKTFLVPISNNNITFGINIFFESRKMRHQLKFTKRKKDTRVQWNRNHMDWSDEWLSVLVNDENKINVNGPRVCTHY